MPPPNTTQLLAALAAFFLSITYAQNPRNVAVRAFQNQPTCRGASTVRTVPINNNCQRFNAFSYRLNRDDDDCVLASFSDNNCRNRIAIREFDFDNDDDDSDDDCERLPRRARSFRVRCNADDTGTEDDD